MDHKPIQGITDLINKLRGEGGCPWIREQTFSKHLEEVGKELEEVKEAFHKGDNKNLEEELGDLLWDVLTLIRISEDEYNLKLKDISNNVLEKMMRRKPYIFGDEKAETPEEAVKIWERVKMEEKKR